MSDVEDLTARLDRQAAYIKKLAARVKVLEGVAKPASDVREPGTVGAFAPSQNCLACGRGKEPGRSELTCRPCGRERQAQIKARALPVTPKCGNCGDTKTGTQILCAPCSASYKKWKEGKS
jgi:hypothetical protein